MQPTPGTLTPGRRRPFFMFLRPLLRESTRTSCSPTLMYDLRSGTESNQGSHFARSSWISGGSRSTPPGTPLKSLWLMVTVASLRAWMMLPSIGQLSMKRSTSHPFSLLATPLAGLPCSTFSPLLRMMVSLLCPFPTHCFWTPGFFRSLSPVLSLSTRAARQKR